MSASRWTSEDFRNEHGDAAWVDVVVILTELYDDALELIEAAVSTGTPAVDAFHAGSYSLMRQVGDLLGRNTETRCKNAAERGAARRRNLARLK